MQNVLPFIHVSLCIVFFLHSVEAQQANAFLDERADEDYSYLKDSSNLEFLNRIKYISLGKNSSSYLSVGGSFRPRYEYYGNRSWQSSNENYYVQRLTLHGDLQLGALRIFTELQHGFHSRDETFLQSDVIDLHQIFIDYSFSTTNTSNYTFSLGRQELKLGSGRLVDLRVGPNLRRTFDAAKMTYQRGDNSIDFIYGKEVSIEFDAFDNAFELFNSNTSNPQMWGIYGQFNVFTSDKVDDGGDFYYLGFQSDQSSYSDTNGSETRHSIGVRKYGNIGTRFTYNSEIIYQFGDIDNQNISAFNIETDWQYAIPKKWRPTIGLKLDWSSGDRNIGDGKINSFNPMFVNPATYSLAAINTPINLFSLHPSLLLFPTNKFFLNLDFATFFRSSNDDGVYAPPRIQSRTANGLLEKYIGYTIGLFTKYTFNKFVSFDIRTAYFNAGEFIERTGSSENIYQFASTLSIIF